MLTESIQKNYPIGGIGMSRIIICITTALTLLCMGIPVFAEKGPFFLEAGARGTYSSGLTEDNLYGRYFIQTGYSGPFMELSLNGTFYQHYQLTDGAGTYEYINFTQGAGELRLYPFEILELAGAFRYSGGNLAYKAVEYSFEAELSSDPIGITGGYSRKSEEYAFNGVSYKNEYTNITIEFRYEFTDFSGVDAEYTRASTCFENVDTEYVKNTGRLGGHFRIFNSLLVLAGASCGTDSADYLIYGADAGFTWKLFDHIKITSIAGYTYYQAPVSSTSTSTGGGHGTGSSAGSGSGSNPYLDPSLIGTSFGAWNVSFGASVVF